MESDPRRWISTLRSSHDRLVAFVAGLDDDTLERQSMCTEWTVAQVLSHLGSGSEIGLATLEANITGGEPLSDERTSAIWARWNAMSSREQATAFAASDKQQVAAFEALDADQLAELRVKLPFLPEPIDVATTVGFRLGEHALHSWDVFAAFDPSAGVAPDATELLIDRLPMMVRLIGSFMPRETRPADDVTISVSTSSPTRHYELELGDVADLRPAAPGSRPDGDLAIPAEALLRLTSGRLKPGRPSADVVPSGALSLDQLRTAFPGY